MADTSAPETTPPVAKHYRDTTGIYIHTNFDLNYHTSFPMFVAMLESSVAGIDRINTSRYSIGIIFGFLIDQEEVIPQILTAFHNLFGVDASTLITMEEVAEKIEGPTEEQNLRDLMKFAEFFGKGPADA